MNYKETTVKDFLGHIYEFYRKIKNYQINIMYEGRITHQITKAFTTLTELDLEKSEESFMVKKRVFHVMVESLQNITKHAIPSGSVSDEEKGRGIFLVSKGEGHYRVITGNLTCNKTVTELSTMLDKINKMNVEDLRQLYKKQIRDGRRLSDRGGAGLGFIDIVRKTGNPIEYNIIPIENNENSFFILGIQINI